MSASTTVRASLRPTGRVICKACRSRLDRQTRSYAAAATAEATTSPSSHSEEHASLQTQSQARKAYRLTVAPVVSRPPLLTREATTFERAFYLYQKRLNERLALPATRYFYYPKGTPSDLEWKRKYKARQTAARDIGVYNAYAKEGWQDEVLLGDTTGEYENIVESLFQDAEGRTITGAQPMSDKNAVDTSSAGDATIEQALQKRSETTLERPSPRVTEADKSNDLKSLNRRLDRSLYLLVRDASGRWRFPEDLMFGKESFYQATERILVQAAGINMNTWVVGNHPIGHYQYDYLEPREATVPAHRKEDTAPQLIKQQEYGGKVFFMKTRIMAGQADLANNIFGHEEFVWLVKEEVQKYVHPRYWSSIANMLTDR